MDEANMAAIRGESKVDGAGGAGVRMGPDAGCTLGCKSHGLLLKGREAIL
jgi:hypothetical protein